MRRTNVRWERDRAAALPVAEHRFDTCVLQAGQVDKYQTVRFDHNSYSVPRRWAFHPVTVKGYVEHVEVVADGQVVARHVRCYGKGERLLDPLHYLVTLERKPAALDHAPVYRDWQLPAAFVELRQALERRLGPRTGSRHFIRVLQLLAHHPLSRIEQALVVCFSRGALDAAAITTQVERLAQASAEQPLFCSKPPICIWENVAGEVKQKVWPGANAEALGDGLAGLRHRHVVILGVDQRQEDFLAASSGSCSSACCPGMAFLLGRVTFRPRTRNAGTRAGVG